MNRDELEVDFFQVTKYLLVWRIGPEDWRREVLGDYTYTLLSTNSGYSKDGDRLRIWRFLADHDGIGTAPPQKKKKAKLFFMQA